MEYDQQTYRRNLANQYRVDCMTLISQGRWPPPWVNEDYTIQQDEGRLLSSIADNAGLSWRDDDPSLCSSIASMLGMTAIGNAKATIKRCIQLGYVKAQYCRDLEVIRLNLTDLGAAMLELWEDENSESNV